MWRLTIFILVLSNCSKSMITEKDLKLQRQAQGLFGELPTTLIDQEKEADKISLGEKLYFETRLSINDKISCNSCHRLDMYGVDNEITSPGHDGTRGGRNSPTVYNAALNTKQFWDGRAADFAEQAIGPILNPIEHGLRSEKEALKKISSSEYLALFKKAFPDQKQPFTYKNIGHAIAAFENTLITTSRFDDYLDGDIKALTTQERKGLQKFVEVGCTACHSGPGLGGTSFQKLGLVKDYPTKDMGRFESTGKRRDKKKFKVPLLRNITKTGPYLHDGSIASLDETIELMVEYQIGKKLKQSEIEDIKAFLTSLEAKELYKK